MYAEMRNNDNKTKEEKNQIHIYIFKQCRNL